MTGVCKSRLKICELLGMKTQRTVGTDEKVMYIEETLSVTHQAHPVVELFFLAQSNTYRLWFRTHKWLVSVPCGRLLNLHVDLRFEVICCISSHGSETVCYRTI